MDLLEELWSTHEVVAGGSWVGVEGGERPCRDEVQLEMEAGARC
jgi:hypothetical protein